MAWRAGQEDNKGRVAVWTYKTHFYPGPIKDAVASISRNHPHWDIVTVQETTSKRMGTTTSTVYRLSQMDEWQGTLRASVASLEDSETCRGTVIGEKDKMPWASVDLGDHQLAVTVFGSTQAEADARAARLARGWNALTASEGEAP